MKITCFLFGLTILAFASCKKSENKNNWTATIKNVISSSSPREVDLNGDGILDIVIGAGNEALKRTEK